ncbi:MAG: galactose-1-phosphate uridylyltransferase [Thermotogota bacterium]
MNELRKDPVTKRWVIFSPDRGKRPNSYDYSEDVKESYCPFDYGNEDSTPDEVLSFRNKDSKPNDSGWWVRVVPNKFPALNGKELVKEPHGMYDKISGYGYHEVIIETPEHNTNFSEMSKRQLKEVIWAYIKRFNEIKKDENIKYIQIFKNKGKRAGASLKHPHSQLIATPIIPMTIVDEIQGANDYFNFRDRCVFCDIIRQEIEEKERVIFQTENFLTYAPYASRFPYETSIIPRFHECDFGRLSNEDDLIEELAAAFYKIFRRFKKVLNDPPFNLVLHTSPFREKTEEFFHWHFEIIPRLTNIAGFEWGTGFYINTVAPEKAAKDLRKEEEDL